MKESNINNKLVSIIIPTYKRVDTILETIQSVLNQTYKNIEIIVVDDNGKDTYYQKTTEQLLNKYIKEKKIIYIPHKNNRNGSAARNTGLIYSHGEYINFLDDDDKLYPTKIEEQIKRIINTNKSIGATYCNSKIIHYQNITHRLIEKYSNVCKEGNLCKEYILGKAKFNTSMIMFKREAIEYLGGFDESYVRHQDYELMIRFFRHYNIVCTSMEPLAIYDLRSERINTPNCEKDFLMKEKLLSSFSDDFEKYGFKKEIGHYIWLRCAINCALKKNYHYVKKSLILSQQFSNITVIEYIKIFKSLIVGLIK